MGSFFSKRDIETGPAVVYTPAATPATPSASTPSADEKADAEKVASAVRKRALPQTILTSFRGVLDQGSWAPQRKSLLGE